MLMMSSPNQISGELIIVDSMTGRETGALEQDVVDCFQEEGVVEPNAGTPLEHMCVDKCDAALRYLEERYHQRFRRDYSTLREGPADSMLQPTVSMASSATLISLILNFCTFPVTVIGNSSSSRG